MCERGEKIIKWKYWLAILCYLGVVCRIFMDASAFFLANFLQFFTISLEKSFFSLFRYILITYSSSSSQFYENLLFYTYIYTWASRPSLLFFFACFNSNFFFVSHFSEILTNWHFLWLIAVAHHKTTLLMVSHLLALYNIRGQNSIENLTQLSNFTQTERKNSNWNFISPVLTSTNYDRMIVCYCIFSFPS